ncbi:MAG: response regulator [Cyanothece sp. SIO2G6]|nr:response regulator [Cyanothece sp. SIO2G6]
MIEADDLLEFIEEFIYTEKGVNLSDLQRTILLSSLQGGRTTYEQIAEDCGYSVSYVRQDIAPKLWLLLSDALGQKITKANARAVLERERRERPQTPRPRESGVKADVAGASGAGATMAAPDSPILGSIAGSGVFASEPLGVEALNQPDTILLVDDQPKNLKLLSDVLEEQGYVVQQAISGMVALQAIALAPPDLLLLDIQMPEMDGYTVCQTLKADPKTQDIPVIFVSAMDEAWDKVKAFSVGGSDYITKPFKLVEVLARVENQLKIWKLQQALKRQNAQLQQAIRELNRLAAIDPVTQLANRDRFDAYLQEVWQQGLMDKIPLSLVMCAVAGLDGLNQTDGKQAGDRGLRHLAHLMKKVAQRPDDLACRYGEVTFAIILPSLGTEATGAIAQTLLNDFHTLTTTSATISAAPAISLSIGVVTMIPTGNSTEAENSTETGASMEELLQRGDRALNDARAKGANCFVVG